MINKTEFDEMRLEFSNINSLREDIISSSRVIIKLSKQAIYAAHRNDISSADKFLLEMEDKLKNFSKNRDFGMAKAALQEYVEAKAYVIFVKEERLVSKKECNVDSESYLLGLCDLSGELVRKAVNDVISGKGYEVGKIRNFLGELYSEFLNFDFRNGELRKKSDALRWSLSKIEDLMVNRND